MTSLPKIRNFALLAVAAAALSSPAAAQTTKSSGPIYGVIGNFAVPFGNLGDAFGLAVGAGGFVEATPAGFPVMLRGEGVYNRFSGKDGRDGLNVLQFTGNAIFNFPAAGKKAASPVYAIGGLGVYRTSANGFSSTDLGFNLGGGYNMKASSYKPFVEARLHFVDQSEWLSVGFGIRF
jgi:hypothetical protein